MSKDHILLNAKSLAIQDLEYLRGLIEECVNEGLVDANDHYYNEIIDLITDVRLISNWDELEEIVAIAKTVELDINAWLSRKGRTTLSLDWPKKPI